MAIDPQVAQRIRSAISSGRLGPRLRSRIANFRDNNQGSGGTIARGSAARARLLRRRGASQARP